ncbi:MAG: Hsp20 family protein, partial [Halobacteria archaeon]|nr:Hsp20 family protein [Halobacteria archaeon]
ALGFGAVQTRDVEEVLENDRVQAYVDELREFSPSGARVIIDERDAYMAKRLLELGRRGDDVVAVVGAGHEAGVEEYLSDPPSIPDVVETVEGISPKADVLENSDEVKVVVDLPGCSEDEIDIRFSDGLVVEASPEKPFEPGYHYSEEGRPRSFETTVEVPRDVEPESATAEYKKGALHVHLPKPE